MKYTHKIPFKAKGKVRVIERDDCCMECNKLLRNKDEQNRGLCNTCYSLYRGIE